MNLLEFKRRLMTDPYSRDPEFRAARGKGGEFAEAAAEAERFECRLKQALEVPVPARLAEEIILRQSAEPNPGRPGSIRFLAAAAAVVLAVAVGTFVVIDQRPASHSLDQHLVWHWQTDGAEALAMSARAPMGSQQVQQVLSEFGLQIDDRLLERVRLSKFCPTPDGTGAHVVLEAEDGPVTLFYMPRTEVPGAPMAADIGNGMEAYVVNLERGSLAVVAESGRDIPGLAEEIRRQVSFPPGLDL